jgi:hypothetical protein
MKKYFLITIDTECDKRTDWTTRYPFEFRSITEGIPDRLQPLFRRSGVKATYLLSPEIIGDPKCARVLGAIGEDHELGTHLHGEYIEPQADFEAAGTMAFQGDYPAETEYDKLKNLTKLFTETFGYRPTAFRAGRFGIGKESLNFLNQLGYLVDSSVFPLKITPTVRHQNNFYDAPVKAYFPDLKDYAREDESVNLLELPLTVHSRFFLNIPRSWRKSVASHPLWVSGLSKLLGRDKVKTYSLRPSTNSYDQMKAVVDGHIRIHHDDEPVFLNMMFHSNEIIEEASPYCRTSADVSAFLGRMEKLFQYLEKLNIQYIRQSDAWFIMKGKPIPSGKRIQETITAN